MNENSTLTPDELTRLYGALRSELNNLSVQSIRNTVAAGIDASKIPSRSEDRTGLGSRAEVMPAIDKLLGQLDNLSKERALCIIAERLVGQNQELADRVQEILGKHGYQFISGSFVPVDILDKREFDFLRSDSASELTIATSRLMNGDYSGAITSACGTVDIIMQDIYQKYGLENPGRVFFKQRLILQLSNCTYLSRWKTSSVN